jgi:hypothetical protein
MQTEGSYIANAVSEKVQNINTQDVKIFHFSRAKEAWYIGMR